MADCSVEAFKFHLFRFPHLHNVERAINHPMKHFLLVSLLVAVTVSLRAGDVKSLSDFQAAAEKANEVLTIPAWPKTPVEVQGKIDSAIAKANAALDAIGKQDLSKVTFESTVGALDNIQNDATIAIQKRSSFSRPTRTPRCATRRRKRSRFSRIGRSGSITARTFTKRSRPTPTPSRSSKARTRSCSNTPCAIIAAPVSPSRRRNARRSRSCARSWRNSETDFQANIVAVKAPVVFTKAELEGVPDSILESPGVKTGDDSYTILANVTFHYNTVEETAKKEETRKHLYQVRFNLAREKNVPVLNDILAHRNQIALKLGYKSWDDFQTEIKMAKNGAAAKTFINDLVAGIQPKFDAEVAELRKLKVAETKDPERADQHLGLALFREPAQERKIHRRYGSAARLFPVPAHARGMFNIYQSIFGLKFTKIIAPEKWVDDLQLYMVTDAASGQPLGMFYLDMFPRDGKFNHFAEFGIIPGKLLPNGKYQRPTVALICNFPPPSQGQAFAPQSPGRRDALPRIRPRPPRHRDDREICALLRHERPGGFRRSALADAAKLGLEQEGARHFRGRLSRSVEEDSRRRRSRK